MLVLLLRRTVHEVRGLLQGFVLVDHLRLWCNEDVGVDGQLLSWEVNFVGDWHRRGFA